MAGNTYPFNFQHIVAVADKNNESVSIFVDGSLRQTTNWDGPKVNSINLMLGKRGGNNTKDPGYPSMMVDELRIYNKALKEEDVVKLYINKR